MLEIKVRPTWERPVVLPPLDIQTVRVRPEWVRPLDLPNLPDQRVNVRTDVDRKGLDAASGAFRAFAVGVAAFAVPAALSGLSGTLTAVAGAAVTASGALLTLPAAALAVGAGIATVKLATTGMGDAFTAVASGDAAKLQAAMANLAPSARAFVTEIQAVKPAFDSMQGSVQQAFFSGLSTTVGQLAGTYLPILRTQLTGVAAAMNESAQYAGRALMAPQAVGEVNLILGKTGEAFRVLTPAIGNVITGILGIGGVGAQYLPAMAQAVTDLTERFRAWVVAGVESGRINELILAGVAAARQLGELFGNIGSIIGSVFQAAQTSGGGFLGTLIQITGAAATFLSTGVGFQALVSIFQAIRDVTAAILPGLLALAGAVAQGIAIIGPALAPIAAAFSAILIAVSPLIPVLAQVAAFLGQALAQAMQTVAPLFATIAQVVGEVLLVALDALRPVLPILLDAFRQLVPPLQSLAETVGQALVSALTTLAPFLPPLVEQFGRILLAAVPLIEPLVRIASTILDALIPILPMLIGLFLRLIEEAILPLLPPLIRLIEAILPGVVATIEFLIPIIEKLAGIFIDVLVWAIENVVIPAIDILTGVITACSDFWRGLSDTVTTVWAAITAAVTMAWNFIRDAFNVAVTFLRDLWNGFWSGLQGVATTVWTAVSDFFTGAFTGFTTFFTDTWNNIRLVFETVWNTVRDFAVTVWNNISQFFTDAFNNFKTAFQIIWDTVSGIFNTVWTFIRDTAVNLWNQISQFFTDAFENYKRGFQIIWDAVSGIFNTVWTFIRDTAVNIWNGISAFFTGAFNNFKIAFQQVGDAVSAIWQGFWNVLSSVASSVFNAIKGTIDTVITGIVTAFQFVVRTVGDIWAGIKRLLAIPINFMIGTVYNGGIVKAWNFVAGLIPGINPIGPLPLIPEFAKGGPVAKPTVGLIGEAGPEYVLSAPAVRGLGGMDAVDRMHTEAVARQPRTTLSQLNSRHTVEGADHNGPGTLTQGFGGVRPHVAQAGHFLRRMFGIGTVGGIGQRSGPSDHPRGLALDFMTYNDQAKGDRLADYAVRNAAHLAIKYIIWKQRINQGGGWKGMADRGSITANHFDHPHVSFLDGPGGGQNFSGGGAGGGFLEFLNPIPGMIRGFFETVTNPLVDAIPGGPPQFLDIPRNLARFARDKVLDFLLGKGEEAGAATDPTGVGAPTTGDQLSNARIIGNVARSMGFGRNGLVVALATALQESGLRNLNYGDRDSLGLFQQRPSQGWGTPAQIMTPSYSARKFFDALRGVRGWEGLPVTVAAQRVQRSAFPNAYAKHVGTANSLATQVGFDVGGLAKGRGMMFKNVIAPERTLDPRTTVAFEQLVGLIGGTRGATPTQVVSDAQWRERGRSGGDAGPMIGSLTVPVPEGAGVKETVDEVMFAVRHARRGGVHS